MRVTLSHGAGGAQSQKLIGELIKIIENRQVEGGLGLDDLDDCGTVPWQNGQIVFTTDGHTVNPLFFPGGDIGRLAVAGTVNDLTVMGAQPVALSMALVIEEGLEFALLEKVFQSINEACKEAGVAVIAGDTKVVERGAVDKLIITTAGIGLTQKVVRDNGIQPGDKLIISGTIGDHGIALLSKREGYDFKTTIQSDVAPLNKMLEPVLGCQIHAMKDPTRGGIAMVLNEMAEKSGVNIVLKEDTLPIQPEVRGACEMLGLDPFTLANEGKVVMAVAPQDAETVLGILKKHEYGKNAVICGEAVALGEKESPRVILQTDFGKRVVRAPIGEIVPRIC